MAAPSMVHAKGDTLVIRSVVDGEDLYGSEMRKRIEESVSNAFLEQNIIQDTTEEPDLPQCKIKRNYACNSCDYFTQNPRTYLHHLRDVHFEKIKIYECSSCLYASKHSQKLQRHIHMVHVMGSDGKKRQANKNTKPKVFPPVQKVQQLPLPVQVISTPTIPSALLESNVSNTDSDENPMMEDDLRISSPISQGEGTEKQFRCSMCMFFSHNANLVSRHERVFHSKKKTFKCQKCNYVTHMKARFTKHVKYHSMPMIKCELCDFRTPYKWNLDRHWKNHTGEGAFKCSLCNFTADIKQSLTVHEMNHHVPSAGQAAMRRRNRVGGSDLFLDQEEEANDMDEQEMIRLEREDQNSSDMQNEAEDQHYTDMRAADDNSDSDSGSVNQQGHHFGGDMDSNSNEALNLQNGFLKLNQCRVCSFKSAWESELKHHESQTHGLTDTQRGLPSPPPSQEEKKKPARPIPNLIPIQAPSGKVGSTSPSHESQGVKPEAMSDKDLNDIYAKQCPTSALKDFASVIGGVDVFNNTPTDLSLNDTEKTNDSNSSAEENKKYPDLFKKKNASFFDKLKERLMTTTSSNEPGNYNLHCKHCPHVSKCLSEYILHQKLHSSLDSASVPSPSSVATSSSTGSPIHNGGSASTRCQFCRQRCKSSGDLLVHLQMCSQALANEESQHSQSSSEMGHVSRYQQDKENEEGEDLRTSSSRVFVWNNIPSENHPAGVTRTPTPEPPVIQSTPSPSVSNTTEDQGWRSKSPSESSLMGFETTPGYGSVTSKTKSGSHGHMNPNPLPETNGGPGRGELTLKKVYKCPHCAFWASTASRFHVHIVGHLNKKPFECSLCAYRSNWRWDITKHIRLKTIRDPAHEAAKVLMTDETGRRNYTKYNKYLTLMKVHEPNAESSGSGKRSNQQRVIPNTLVPHPRLAFPMAAAFMGENPFKIDSPFKRPAPSCGMEEEPSAKFMRTVASANISPNNNNNNEGGACKKTMWKCKKCLFKDGDKSVVLAHVKDHYRDATISRLGENGMDNMADVSEVRNMTIAKLHEQSLAEHNNNNISKEDVAKMTNEEDDDQEFVLYCEMCEFKTTSSADYESHLTVHYPRESSNNVSYRCYKCSFSSMSKSTLMDHLQTHGIQEDIDLFYPSYNGRHLPKPPPPVITSEVKKFKCSLCPYVSNNRSQFDNHRQFHHPSGAAFQCSLCSYAVSKRHLLHQHMRVHGITLPQPKSSSPQPQHSSEDTGEELPDTPADISGRDTSKCKEIPLVWVSRQGTINKMHKCRFCPHVNVRKSNIQEHEKMHSTRSPKLLPDGSSAPPLQQHYCPDCNYICNNAGVLSSHAKVHQGMFGTVCALYDASRSDQEQIKEVLVILSSSKYAPKQVVVTSDNETIETTPDISALLEQSAGQDETETDDDASRQTTEHKVKEEPAIHDKKLLHFCSECPARFLFEKELMIHSKFHSLQLTHKCWSCSYTARQEQHLQAHYKVHTDEYQDRTKVLLTIYSESPKYPRNKTAVVLDNPGTPGYIWVVVNDSSPQCVSMSNPPFSLNFNINNTIINNKVKDNKRPPRVITKQFSCTKCPAQFFKSVALQYHLTLHGGNGPHKCRSCDYAVKTYGNLIKHEQVHDTLAPRIKCKLLKPPRQETNPMKAFAKPEYHMKNIDPEFGFLMLGNPNFNYPTYIKNGKVKTKRYKCHKCPSAFEKREQYKVHLSLHGAQQKYRCDKCDYSVKYYANYIQHIRKHEKSESFDDVVNSGKVESSPSEDVKPQVKTESSKPNLVGNNDMARLKEEFHLCKFCPYASTNLNALQNHIQKHHNIPEDIAKLLQKNGSSLTLERTSSAEDLRDEPISSDLKVEDDVEEADPADFIDDNMVNMDDVDSYNEPDDYDEDLERKFVLSSMRNGGTIPVDDLDDSDGYNDDDFEDATDNRYGNMEVDNDNDSDDGDDVAPDDNNPIQSI